ncbi:DNA-binding protein [Lacticaseibacillus chiayiensis]|uniref:DNA-binding protein n=1 Tax=Lacticaseibacillus chiayiensis TaxID=2100821 RepID=A0A4Q1U6D3_9LACO|nr:DNA-binding protein [Lacticaseibacillus chiayiensis]QVI34838.1 DNA-binding protein [Lacticaseibacillus chiayiensis]RXT27196.1 DNA-binding protein [Lacticaseibacillus chiayiensis]UYN56592.1 DNA-binding protein [Lacticaseibacillus chiayiensis]
MSVTTEMQTISAEQVKTRQAAAAKQADHDHHVPTAGAMSGHVLANLQVLARKLEQFRLTLNGPSSETDRQLLTELLGQVRQHFSVLANDLAAQGEDFPTTTAEFDEYTMLKEDPALRFWTNDMKLDAVVNDLDTCQLFVSRAIPLADKENKLVLAADMLQLQRWHEQSILRLQTRLGREVTAGRDLLDEDEDD